MFLSPDAPQNAAVALLLGAAMGGYVATLAAANALGGDHAPASRRGIVHACYSGVIAIAATIRKPMLADVAVGVPFSACVAALSLALGVVVFVTFPIDHRRTIETSPQAARRRLWALMLPATLLALLIGFHGELTPMHALVLIANGCGVLVFGLPHHQPREPADRSEADSLRSIVQLLLAAGLAFVCAQAAVDAAAGLAAHAPIFRPGVAASLLLAPAVVLPMIPSLATLAETGRRDEAINAVIVFVLLNLCAVIPAVIGTHELTQLLRPVQYASTLPVEPVTSRLLFPLTVWRLDAILLVVIALFLLPVAIGRWTLSRAEGFMLVMVYVGYLFLTLLASRGS